MPVTRSQAARHTRIPLAGGGQETLLSEVGFVLLPHFSTAEACALRLVCREFLAAVAEHPWEDRDTVIQGSIAAWRACFPRALCANVEQGEEEDEDGGTNSPGSMYWTFRRRARLVDADFVHFEGLRELNMAGCVDVTDAAFAHLRGIQKLFMSYCDQDELTDAAFAHLRGIHTLHMNRCRQDGITDAAFVHLRGIQVLNMSECSQDGITDAAFAHLRGIQRLDMGSCRQAGVTDAAFAHLRGIQVLRISHCPQVTDAAFVHLHGIKTLYMWSCPLTTDAIFVHLKGIRTLVMAHCNQPTITGATLHHLKGIAWFCAAGMDARVVPAAVELKLAVTDCTGWGGQYGWNLFPSGVLYLTLDSFC